MSTYIRTGAPSFSRAHAHVHTHAGAQLHIHWIYFRHVPHTDPHDVYMHTHIHTYFAGGHHAYWGGSACDSRKARHHCKRSTWATLDVYYAHTCVQRICVHIRVHCIYKHGHPWVKVLFSLSPFPHSFMCICACTYTYTHTYTHTHTHSGEAVQDPRVPYYEMVPGWWDAGHRHARENCYGHRVLVCKAQWCSCSCELEPFLTCDIRIQGLGYYFKFQNDGLHRAIRFCSLYLAWNYYFVIFVHCHDEVFY